MNSYLLRNVTFFLILCENLFIYLIKYFISFQAAWPHQPTAWPATPGTARYPVPYMPPMMAPPYGNPFMLRPLRPPPYGMPPYGAPFFRPRFPPRQARGHFRPRNHQ